MGRRSTSLKYVTDITGPGPHWGELEGEPGYLGKCEN